MKRYRVRVATKTYSDPGPDLLRPQGTAVQAFGSTLGSASTQWFARVKPATEDIFGKWAGPMPRRELLERAERFMTRAPKSKFQAGRKKAKEIETKSEMLIVHVAEFALSGVNMGAKVVAWLAKEQFPEINIGGFVCREYNGIPGSGWSDHAWGDAVDLVPSGGSPGPNDRLTDWCVRMAKAHCMGDVNQFIGSNRGRVYSFIAPNYSANAGGPISHLTHVHCSYRQHFGANPRCQ